MNGGTATPVTRCECLLLFHPLLPTYDSFPFFRSIAVAHAPHRSIHIEPSLKRESPGRMEPLSEYGRVASDQSYADISLKNVYIDETASPCCAPCPGSRWQIDDLPPHPNDYPVERTSRIICGVDVDIVSSRLSKCLQARSIETKFAESEAHVVLCRNRNFVKFYIRLFSAPDENGVLVELQRLWGDCMSFMQDCRALLDASEGIPKKAITREEPSLVLSMPISEMSFFKTATLPPVDETEPVNMTANLLASNESDSNLLGMESLSTLTDVNKTHMATAVLSAKRLLCPEHEDNRSFNMHNYVMSLITYNDESQDNHPLYEGTALEDHTMKLRNLAVCSVANSLSLMASEGHLFDDLHSCCEWYRDVLVPQLVQDLTSAKENLHDACYASRCLNSLAQSCSRCVDKIKVVGGLSALKFAQEVGQTEFALLEKDAKCCCEIIQRYSVY